MNLYLVTCNLKTIGLDYTDFFNAVESLENCQIAESIWLIYTKFDSVALFNFLCVSLGENDLLFITRVTGDSIGWLDDEVRLWLEGKIAD